MNLKAEKWLIQIAVVSNTSLIVVLWTNDVPCIHESLGTDPSLFIPTNKSYFPVEKKSYPGERTVTWGTWSWEVEV